MPSTSSNDARPAVQELIDSIRSVFKKYTKKTRDIAWHNGILSAQGKNAVDKMIKNPSVPIVGTARFISFKEWINHS